MHDARLARMLRNAFKVYQEDDLLAHILQLLSLCNALYKLCGFGKVVRIPNIYMRGPGKSDRRRLPYDSVSLSDNSTFADTP